MSKKATGYTPVGRAKSNPLDKQGVPLKAPGIAMGKVPNPLSSPNMIKAMPKADKISIPKPKV